MAGFVGCCGVYDIDEHYKFERERGVHEISPMSKACLGERRKPAAAAGAGETLAADEDNLVDMTFPRTSVPSLLLEEDNANDESGLALPQPRSAGTTCLTTSTSTSTSNSASNSTMRVLLLHGSDDRVVPTRQSHLMEEALVSSGSCPAEHIQVSILPGEGHAEFIGAMMVGKPTPFLDRIVAFVEEVAVAVGADVEAKL